MRGAATSAAAALLLSACAGIAPVCPAGADGKMRAELLFGRNIGDRLGVSDQDFRRFVDSEVTPRFPDGFTILDARGQYRDGERNRIVREPSKVIMIVLSDAGRDMPRLNEIADAYKKRFQQRSVGIVTQPACARF